MMIPDPSDPRWRRVLTSQSDLSAASLATRILISRLRREVELTPSSILENVALLRAFFIKNSFAHADFARF
jgi:hypothetical protein